MRRRVQSGGGKAQVPLNIPYHSITVTSFVKTITVHSVRFQRVCFCLVGMRGQVNAKFFVLIGKFGQISSHLYNVVLGH